MIVKGLLFLLAVFCVLMTLLIWAKSGRVAAAGISYEQVVT